jgi:hypothetical protein
MNPVTPNTSSASTGTPSDAKKILLKDIGAKWGKFSEQELGALKNKDDLITQVVAKYSIDKTQAQRDVDAVMKGRQICSCRLVGCRRLDHAYRSAGGARQRLSGSGDPGRNISGCPNRHRCLRAYPLGPSR